MNIKNLRLVILVAGYLGLLTACTVPGMFKSKDDNNDSGSSAQSGVGGYKAAREDSMLTGSNIYLGYRPIDPVYARRIRVYDPRLNRHKVIHWESLKPAAKLRLLPIQSARVSMHRVTERGRISYLTGAVSGKKGNYTVIMDYMKYRIIPVYDEGTQKLIGHGKVGIGMRIKAQIRTMRANLNLGSLFKIGLEASRGNIEGGLSVDVIGIDSQDVTNLIPLTSVIDQTSIQSALQAFASIKTKIYTEGTRITPHLVAIHAEHHSKASKVIQKSAH